MAPGRRKGSGRAAAAAAQQQQWKVGDLVLAKMKGFPAWPAMISEPEKWGFSSVRKKLLVYFYGTKQIAFCNYADIEAFSEEKKKSLLIKRQGKGADFVRAVDEIIDVYENMKKQNDSGGDESIVPNAGNLEFPTSNSVKKSPELSSDVVQNHKAGGLCTSTECHDIHSSEENSVMSMEVDPHNVNQIINESIEEVSILDHLRKTPLATSTTSWKKRSRDAPTQGVIVQRRMPSLRRSRSSSIGETPKFQEAAMLLDDSDIATGDLIPDALQEEPTRRKGLGTVQQPSDVPDVVVPVSAGMPLNGSSKEFVSEMAELKFGANNLTEGSALESGCKLEVSANGCLGKEERLNRKLDLPVKAAICKKKRRPNRKRVINITDCVSLDKEADMQVELSGSLLESPNSHHEMNEGFQKADGDQHLPLVKRARVRMGKPPVDEAQLDEFAANSKKSEVAVLVHKSESRPISTSPGNDCLANGTLVGAKEDLDLSNDCSLLSRKNLMFWKVKKYQLRGLTLDAEAALPPSKRLNRALEAMSANAAEGTNDCPEGMISNGCVDSPKASPLHPCSDSNVRSPTRLHGMQSSDNNALDSSASGLCSRNMDTTSLASSEKKSNGILPGDHRSPKNTHCNEILMDAKNCDQTSLSKMADMDIHDKSPQPHVFKSIGKQVSATSCESLPDQFSSSLEKVNGCAILRANEDCSCSHMDSASEYGTAELTLQKLDSVLSKKGGGDSFPPDIADGIVSAMNAGSTASETSGLTKPSSVHSGEDTRTSGMQYGAKEVKYKVTANERCISPDMTPMKDLIAAAQAKRLLSRSTSFSDNYLDSKVVREVVTSPASFQKEENSRQGSSPKSLMKPACYTDDMTGNLQNTSNSPYACLQQRSVNKFAARAEANAARRAFEATLCTLSRTKESIGRATRHAIECAKYGIAGEVVEILLQNLERESNLYKRVDLFFLVDSITQCSRSQKGGAGDIYPSLIQSVLPRLLCAASPPGNAASENRRQCLKVLKLWLERKTLPESIIRQHIRELDSANEASLSSAYSRRPSRTERALHDPVREMEGMLVDEYGSNTSFQLPGLLHANVLEDDEDSVSDEKSFEAVTPEQHVEVDHEEGTEQPSTEKHRHILEDVDGELEMEDVAPPCEVEMTSKEITCTPHVVGSGTVCNNHQLDEHHSSPFAPPLPEETPPSQPPLPSSPPPVVAPCSTAQSVVLQRQSGSLATPADTADLHHPIVTHSMQNQQCQSSGQHPSNLNGNVMSTDSVRYHTPGYGGPPKQMPPPVSSLGPSSFDNRPFSHPVVHSTNNFHPFNSAPLPSKAYHLQHPAPTVPNQFSYMQAEPQQRAQPLGNCSSFTERFQYVHDMHRGNLYGDRGPSGPIQHDIRERGRFSPTVHSGPLLSRKAEAPPSSLSHYGPSMEPLPVTCPGWPPRPRMSDYASASRSSVDAPITEVAGAHVYWRPR